MTIPFKDSSVLGTPTCPGCKAPMKFDSGYGVTADNAGIFYCDVCDKDEMEQRYKEAKALRVKRLQERHGI